MDITSYLLGKNSGGGGGSLDWAALGYDSTPEAIIDGYNYAKHIQETWTSTSRLTDGYKNVFICPYVDTSSQTSWYYFAGDCSGLIQIPLLDTSNVKVMTNAFANCTALKYVPKFNTSNVVQCASMFSGCSSLSTESLENILQMCIDMTSYTEIKTLYYLGFRSVKYPASTIQALPSYQDFIDAGWTIGY